MKKKILALLALATISTACLSGCNQQILDFNFEFRHAYVKIGEEWQDIEIMKWTDYEDGEQIQLTLKDGTVMVVHAANCILYNGTLPKGD